MHPKVMKDLGIPDALNPSSIIEAADAFTSFDIRILKLIKDKGCSHLTVQECKALKLTPEERKAVASRGGMVGYVIHSDFLFYKNSNVYPSLKRSPFPDVQARLDSTVNTDTSNRNGDLISMLSLVGPTLTDTFIPLETVATKAGLADCRKLQAVLEQARPSVVLQYKNQIACRLASIAELEAFIVKRLSIKSLSVPLVVGMLFWDQLFATKFGPLSKTISKHMSRLSHTKGLLSINQTHIVSTPKTTIQNEPPRKEKKLTVFLRYVPPSIHNSVVMTHFSKFGTVRKLHQSRCRSTSNKSSVDGARALTVEYIEIHHQLPVSHVIQGCPLDTKVSHDLSSLHVSNTVLRVAGIETCSETEIHVAFRKYDCVGVTITPRWCDVFFPSSDRCQLALKNVFTVGKASRIHLSPALLPVGEPSIVFQGEVEELVESSSTKVAEHTAVLIQNKKKGGISIMKRSNVMTGIASLSVCPVTSDSGANLKHEPKEAFAEHPNSAVSLDAEKQKIESKAAFTEQSNPSYEYDVSWADEDNEVKTHVNEPPPPTWGARTRVVEPPPIVSSVKMVSLKPSALSIKPGVLLSRGSVI